MSNTMELVRAWRKKSDQDLKACGQLLQADEPLVEIIAFHAQQAVEKALKGFLLNRGAGFPKTHDLGRLLDLVEIFEPELADLEEIINLTPYAIEARYPESTDWSGGVDPRELLELSEKSCNRIWSFIQWSQ
ncbi:MAG: HEPN domain-containing protein [Mariprofundaceae bacterium]|nr:HEPN domain-containing protein [Mariprofundaceae bacterium]